MKPTRQERVLLSVSIGVFVLAGVLLIAGIAFGADCENCKQRADGSWDCKRPTPESVVDGWRAVREKAPIFQKAHPAVCRIFVDRPIIKAGRRAIETTVGSGVLVWRGTKQATVLTVHHLFRDRGTTIRIVFPNGEKYEAQQVQSESDCDLGALTIPRPGVEPMVISEDAPPEPGDHVYLCGFDGKTGSYRQTPGTVKGYAAHEIPGGTSPRHDLVVVGQAVEGNSGGPIIDSKGELVAIIWGTDGRDSHGTYAAQIGAFFTSDKFIAPWRVTPWNAKTDQERIRAAAGAYAPPMAPVAPLAPPGSGIAGYDGEARRMAQEALNQSNRAITLVTDLSKDVAHAHDATTKVTEEAAEKSEETAKGLATLKTGLLGTVKGYVFGLFKTWGLGGLLGGGALGVVLFFVVRRYVGMKIAEYFDKLTDKTPWKWDDKYLDPMIWKAASIMSGKPVPEYANTPGVDPWGKPYPGQQQPPAPVQPSQPSVVQPSSPTNAELLTEIQKLKDKPAS